MDAADTLAFVDLETTGGNPAYDRITEIGIVRVRNGDLIEEWSTLVNPECRISPYIEAFTGISSEMVADAPRFADIAAAVFEKLQGATFIAHNARFDQGFLRSEFRKVGVTYSAGALCTVKLSRGLFPGHARHNLDALIERHGLSCSARHRALGDARVLHDLWQKLQREVPAEAFSAAAAHAVLAVPKLPAQLPPGLDDELPEAPGVYRFYGEDGTLLYIGRSNSLRAKILSQLSSPRPGSREAILATSVRRVDWVRTAGELGALLLESDWIKAQQPLYNRHPQSREQCATLRIPDASGRVRIQAIDTLEPEDLAQSFGVFHTAKDARKALAEIARARQLCLKVLGLEESEGSCFALQVGKCRGACTGKEPLVLHSMRLQLALSALKIKSWPFPGRIALRERATGGFAPDGTRGGEFHVLDRWMYLGSARCEEELAALSVRQTYPGFDGDVYKLLLRYFRHHPDLDWLDLRADKTAAVHWA
ncbi:MAG TPA: exonuclease domain-containing protein [Steroidobacteraceae bacterium]|jgi:DNA polymerase-3 subunit epsilon|nr:exonuclease domain-containing protein [Steroidobacteraceae bacterium]